MCWENNHPFVHPKKWTVYCLEEWKGEQSVFTPGPNFTPRGHSSPLGSQFAPRGEIKNWPKHMSPIKMAGHEHAPFQYPVLEVLKGRPECCSVKIVKHLEAKERIFNSFGVTPSHALAGYRILSGFVGMCLMYVKLLTCWSASGWPDEFVKNSTKM
jgi:hypothetical protein